MSQYLKSTWQTIYYLAPHLPQVQCQFQSTPPHSRFNSELNFRLLVLWRSISVGFGSMKCRDPLLKKCLCVKRAGLSAIESQKTRSINDLATRLWLNNVFLFFKFFELHRCQWNRWGRLQRWVIAPNFLHFSCWQVIRPLSILGCVFSKGIFTKCDFFHFSPRFTFRSPSFY